MSFAALHVRFDARAHTRTSRTPIDREYSPAASHSRPSSLSCAGVSRASGIHHDGVRAVRKYYRYYIPIRTPSGARLVLSGYGFSLFFFFSAPPFLGLFHSPSPSLPANYTAYARDLFERRKKKKGFFFFVAYNNKKKTRRHPEAFFPQNILQADGYDSVSPALRLPIIVSRFNT